MILTHNPIYFYSCFFYLCFIWFEILSLEQLFGYCSFLRKNHRKLLSSLTCSSFVFILLFGRIGFWHRKLTELPAEADFSFQMEETRLDAINLDDIPASIKETLAHDSARAILPPFMQMHKLFLFFFLFFMILPPYTSAFLTPFSLIFAGSLTFQLC